MKFVVLFIVACALDEVSASDDLPDQNLPPCKPDNELYECPEFAIADRCTCLSNGFGCQTQSMCQTTCSKQANCVPICEPDKKPKKCKKALKKNPSKCKNKKFRRMCETTCSEQANCVVAEQMCEPDEKPKKCKKATKQSLDKCEKRKFRRMCETTCSKVAGCKPPPVVTAVEWCPEAPNADFYEKQTCKQECKNGPDPTCPIAVGADKKDTCAQRIGDCCEYKCATAVEWCPACTSLDFSSGCGQTRDGRCKMECDDMPICPIPVGQNDLKCARRTKFCCSYSCQLFSD